MSNPMYKFVLQDCFELILPKIFMILFFSCYKYLPSKIEINKANVIILSKLN